MNKFLLAALSLLLIPSTLADWITLESVNGRKLEAKIISKTDGQATLVRKGDGREFSIKLSTLSPESQKLIKDWEPVFSESDEVDLGPFSKKLYPRTRAEIEAEIEEIKSRPLSSSKIDEAQQKTVNQLNIYRYLCGISYDVKADPELVAKAVDAALACEENGSLSHDLGRSTAECNLTTRRSHFSSVEGYINDSGANNRVHRGHRLWCLFPPLAKTGFGSGKNGYSAMYALDSSGKRAKENWAYPGKGLFPHKYLHGNAWTLYLTEKAPSKDKLKVEVYQLSERPEKPILRNKLIAAKMLPVKWISVERHAINFEPESGTVGKGIYWVRVYGGGVSEGYLVELY